MDGLLHVSLRVSDPQQSAELFADLLDGEIRPTPLGHWGVVCVYTSNANPSWLCNMLEFWPPDRHWRHGKLIEVDPVGQRSYGHVALLCGKSFAEMRPAVERCGFALHEENRGLPALVPVLYDDLGNYYELFPRAESDRDVQ